MCGFCVYEAGIVMCTFRVFVFSTVIAIEYYILGVNVPIYRLRVYCTVVFNFISFGLDCLTSQRRREELNKKKSSLSFFDKYFVCAASLRF